MNFSPNFKFTNQPIFYSHIDYQDAIQEYISKITKSKDVISVYQCGTITVEGISDIDLIIILENPLTDSSNETYDVQKFNSKIQYLFMHQPFLMDTCTFQNLYKIFIIKDIKWLYGKRITIKNISQNDKKLYELFINMDRLSSLIRRFSNHLNCKQLPVRNLLASLNSLKFNIESVSKICQVMKINWVKYIKNITELRKNWFKSDILKNHNMLIQLLNEAVVICYDIAEEIDLFFKKNYTSLAKKLSDLQEFIDYGKLNIYSDSYKVISIDQKLAFSRHVDILKFNSKLNNLIRNLLNFSVVFLPASFSLITESWYKNFKNSKNDDNQIVKALLQRNEAINTHINFLMSNNLNFGSFIDKVSFYKKKQKKFKKRTIIMDILEAYNRYQFNRRFRQIVRNF